MFLPVRYDDDKVEVREKQKELIFDVALHFRLKYICLPYTPEGMVPFFQQGYNCLQFNCALFAQQVVNPRDPGVVEFATPEWLMSLEEQLVKSHAIASCTEDTQEFRRRAPIKCYSELIKHRRGHPRDIDNWAKA